MVDVLTPEQRRFNMSRIRGRDTKPEMILRRGLHARGLRFRLHRRDLPGRPDLVFPRYRAIIFVHGCFWHGHGCELCKIPTTRSEFWKAKFASNVERDIKVVTELLKYGWRVMVVWECATRGRGRLTETEIFDRCEDFVRDEISTFNELAAENQPSR